MLRPNAAAECCGRMTARNGMVLREIVLWSCGRRRYLRDHAERSCELPPAAIGHHPVLFRRGVSAQPRLR